MPGEGNLGALVVQVQADISNLQKGLTSAQKDIGGFSNDASKSIKAVGIAFAAMAVAASAALAKVIDESTKWGEELDRLGRITNTSAANIAQWQYAIEQTDGSVEALNRIFPVLAKNIEAATNSSSGQAKAFKELGVNVRESNGQLKSVNEIMLDVADGVKNTEDKTRALAAATVVLGRGGRELYTTMQVGREGLKQYFQEFDNFGFAGAKLNAFAKNSDDFNDKWKSIAFQFKVAGAALTEALMPQLMALTKEFLKINWVGVAQALVTIASGILKIAEAIEAVVTAASKVPAWATGILGGSVAVGMNLAMGPAGGGAGLPGGGIIPPGQANFLAGIQQQQAGGLPIPGGPAGGGQGAGGGGAAGGLPDPSHVEKLKESFQALNQKLLEFGKQQKTVGQEFGDLWKKTIQGFSDGFGNAFAQMLVNGKSFSEGMGQAFKDLAVGFIAAIASMIIKWLLFIAAIMVIALILQAFGVPIGTTFKAAFKLLDQASKFAQGGVFAAAGAAMLASGGVMARNGLLTAQSGLSLTGSFGESGIPAVLHPGELVTPISKFFDFVKQVSGDVNIAINGYQQDPRILAEIVAAEVDRKRRNP